MNPITHKFEVSSHDKKKTTKKTLSFEKSEDESQNA
jgi:hypothetical protein